MEIEKRERLGFPHYVKMYTQEFTDLFQYQIFPYLHLNDLCAFRRVSKKFKGMIEGVMIEEAFDEEEFEARYDHIMPKDIEFVIRNLKFRKYTFNEKFSFSTFLDDIDRIPKRLVEVGIGFTCGDIEQQTLMLLSPLTSIGTLYVNGKVTRAKWLSVLLTKVKIDHLNFQEVEFNHSWKVVNFENVKSIRIDMAANGAECQEIVSTLPIESFFVTLGHFHFNKSLFKGLSLNHSIRKLGYELSNDWEVRKKELKSINKILLNNKVIRQLVLFGRFNDKDFKCIVTGLWGNMTLKRLEFGISGDKFTKKSFDKLTEIMKAKTELVLLINTRYEFPLSLALSMIGMHSDVERRTDVKPGATRKEKQRVFIQNLSRGKELRGIDAFLTCLEVTMQKNEELQKKVEEMEKRLSVDKNNVN